MTTRIHRLWQPGVGQTKVFLPNFWMRIVEVDRKIPPNVVKFEISNQMTRFDVREYLTKIYNLPVREVRTGIEMGKLHIPHGIDESRRNHRRFVGQFMQPDDKEADIKFAYVVFKKDVKFKFPNLFPKETMEKLAEDNRRVVEEFERKEKEKKEKKNVPLPDDAQARHSNVSRWF